MEAIKATFFQECEELLTDLEKGLLALQDGGGDDDTVNAVFRAVHSIKGGAGAFGFEGLVRFSHVFETLMDGVRAAKIALTPTLLSALLRAADILAENGVFIEAGPSRHNNSQGFYLYSYEPGGNRVEVYSGSYLITAPDWEPVTWNEEERGTGVYWGTALPESFLTYATPDIPAPATASAKVPVFDPS